MPAWLQVVVACTIVLGAIATLVVTLRKFWPWLKRRITITDSLEELPVFMAEVRKTLATQDSSLSVLKHEVLRNNGGSLRDTADRLEKAVTNQGKKLDAHTRALRAVDKKLARDNERIQTILDEKETK
jgi:uncharacterized coiled-coil protein SlyX